MGKRRLVAPLLAAAAAATIALPAAPARAAETCHPPRYDTVACVCHAAAALLTKVTGDEWTCRH